MLTISILIDIVLNLILIVKFLFFDILNSSVGGTIKRLIWSSMSEKNKMNKISLANSNNKLPAKQANKLLIKFVKFSLIAITGNLNSS